MRKTRGQANLSQGAVFAPGGQIRLSPGFPHSQRASARYHAKIMHRSTRYRLIPVAVLAAVYLAHAQSRPSVTKETVDQWMTDLSNWGRWGKDDEMGAV